MSRRSLAAFAVTAAPLAPPAWAMAPAGLESRDMRVGMVAAPGGALTAPRCHAFAEGAVIGAGKAGG